MKPKVVVCNAVEAKFICKILFQTRSDVKLQLVE